MKLEEGMYVRTDDGDITKIKWISQQRWVGLENTVEAIMHLENSMILTYPNDNFKASHNIIDLIEVGDYVNGRLVERKFPEVEYAEQSIKLKGSTDYFYDIHIKTIVTKEQFSQMEYKVGE